jgi:bile acid-coenzyme A ligase
LELYSCAESIGAARITGSEWTAHPGSVGRPIGCDVRILDEDGEDRAVGEVGEVFMRRHGGPLFPDDTCGLRVRGDFRSVGDLGRLDSDGYLYILGRRDDLVIRDGVIVYPTFVEAALARHPSVEVALVRGTLTDAGDTVLHASIEPRVGSSPTAAELDAFIRRFVEPQAVPTVWSVQPSLPRAQLGKVKRSL